jgi:hypothetical protein
MVWKAFALAALAVAVAGCAGYGGGSTVSNQPGHFSLSAGGAQSGSDSYDWQNPGTAARVSYSVGGAGSLSLTIADAAGHQVYSDTLSGSGGSSGTRTTQTGAPGTWRISVSWSGAGGATLSVDEA